MKPIEELREILQRIEEMTDPDDGSNYRSDDREGCLDTIHDLVAGALKDETFGEPAGDCSRCGGGVFHRIGKPGEFNHDCGDTPPTIHADPEPEERTKGPL